MNYSIPKPVSPFTYEKDGKQYVSREWYLFLNSLFDTTGGSSTSIDDLQLMEVFDSPSASPLAQLSRKLDDVSVQVAMLPDQTEAVAQIQASLKDVQIQLAMVSETNAALALISSTGLRLISGAGAPVDGVTGAGTATPGFVDYYDSTGKDRYLNTGTMASPTWVLWARSA